MRKSLSSVLLLSLSGAVALGQRPAVYRGKEEKLPVAVRLQPIAFSHKKHVSVGLTCLNCHPDATEKEQAGLPNTEECMICHTTVKADSHEVRKLAEAHERGERVKWVRVYKVPDFVFFSHANHLKAGMQCATCHGPVQRREVLAKEVSTGMIACMNCHAQNDASNECFLCHQLGH